MVWSVVVSRDNYQTSFRSFNYDYVVILCSIIIIITISQDIYLCPRLQRREGGKV